MKSRACPKSGIKIHETSSSSLPSSSSSQPNQQDFYNRLKEQNRYTGVRIEAGQNEYKEDPFGGFDPFKNMDHLDTMKVTYDKSMYEQLDLNLDNYSRVDLYKLFGLKHMHLSDDNMREAKKVVLKTHPDKSRLEPRFFLFFSKAYRSCTVCMNFKIVALIKQ
jgi:hypothetical protein